MCQPYVESATAVTALSDNCTIFGRRVWLFRSLDNYCRSGNFDVEKFSRVKNVLKNFRTNGMCVYIVHLI